jgi:aldehyde dehydrogenase
VPTAGRVARGPRRPRPRAPRRAAPPSAKDLIPSIVELSGKSPNIFFSDVMAHDDDFLDKAIEGLVLYTFNKGRGLHLPVAGTDPADIYDEFMARCLHRIAAIRQGNPLDTDTQLGPQVSAAQLEKITSYLVIGHNEGAEVLIGGQRAHIDGEFADGYYFQPTVLKGDNKMRVFQEEIFGPVLAVTTFTDDADALTIANDTLYGLLLDVATEPPEGFSPAAGTDDQHLVTRSAVCTRPERPTPGTPPRAGAQP